MFIVTILALILVFFLEILTAIQPPPLPPLHIWQSILAGGSARAVSQAITYPMDAMRTLAQTRKGAKKLSDLGAGVLVSGCLSTSAFAFPTGAIQFTVFAGVKKFLTSFIGHTNGATGTAIAMISSSCASLCSCAVGVPQEVLKQRLVTNIYPNFRTAVKTIFTQEGIKGFYTGWAPTVARNLPYVVITFTTFNHWKTQELKRQEEEGLNPSLDTATSMRFGIGAALIGTLVTQPIDVVKTRMMTQAASNLPPYPNALACVTDIVQTEGISNFAKGLAPRAAYIGPLWAMQFMLNEKIGTYFRQQNAKKMNME